ncbi:MAG: TlpA family protein disulfide reductase [Candidatus Neomarinimicrobiota bacterium]|nr:MAG: TlpA family protein disulfide reductase [Candidatus Neomarinimicrobiota bacterium]
MKKLSVLIFGLTLAWAGESHPKLPDFTIQLVDGKTVAVRELWQEGPLLIDFWATWCVPCKKEMRYLNTFHDQYSSQGFRVLTVNQDTPRSLGKVRSYIHSNRYHFLVGLDPNKQISQLLNAVVLPTTLIVNQDGEIIWQHQGFLPGDEQEIERVIQTVLKESQTHDEDTTSNK